MMEDVLDIHYIMCMGMFAKEKKWFFFFRYGGPRAVNDETRLKLEFFEREEARKEVEAARETPVGQFITRMYKEFRTAKL